MLDKLIHWAEAKKEIKCLILVGSRAVEKYDHLADYDISVFAEAFPIHDDNWLGDIGEYILCIHDSFQINQHCVSTRLVIFSNGAKVDFAFHPSSMLAEFTQALPESYRAGYKVLLDKCNITAKLPAAHDYAFLMPKPSRKEFDNTVDEFWFEAWHVAKFLNRNDLWTAKSRDWAAKTHLLKMIQWNAAARSGWTVSFKQEGRDLRNWLGTETYESLRHTFSGFDSLQLAQALMHSIDLFRMITAESAMMMGLDSRARTEQQMLHIISKLLNTINEHRLEESYQNR